MNNSNIIDVKQEDRDIEQLIDTFAEAVRVYQNELNGGWSRKNELAAQRNLRKSRIQLEKAIKEAIKNGRRR